MKRALAAFTLVEILVAMVVLALLVLLVARLFTSAATLTSSGNKRMDADAQSRALLDRMAVDFAQMVKRSDVDYYLKSSASTQIGNDQIAFYSTVPGYYPPTGSQSPVSVVSYRINAQNKLERIAKGLLWNGVSPSSTPVVFLPSTISSTWPSATDVTASPTPEPDAELIGPYVFRFEYYYLLKKGSLSDTPWDTSAGHTSVNGMQDMAAICVSVAALDPKSRILISDAQLTTLAGRMNDFTASMKPGDLLAQWQAALDATTDMPRPAVSVVRIYERYFYLMPKL
jgi:hypothetical protein